jgi:hypothetical protein
MSYIIEMAMNSAAAAASAISAEEINAVLILVFSIIKLDVIQLLGASQLRSCKRGDIRGRISKRTGLLKSNPGRIYIKGYIYIYISHILSKNREKGYSPILFLSGIC